MANQQASREPHESDYQPRLSQRKLALKTSQLDPLADFLASARQGLWQVLPLAPWSAPTMSRLRTAVHRVSPRGGWWAKVAGGKNVCGCAKQTWDQPPKKG